MCDTNIYPLGHADISWLWCLPNCWPLCFALSGSCLELHRFYIEPSCLIITWYAYMITLNCHLCQISGMISLAFVFSKCVLYAIWKRYIRFSKPNTIQRIHMGSVSSSQRALGHDWEVVARGIPLFQDNTSHLSLEHVDRKCEHITHMCVYMLETSFWFPAEARFCNSCQLGKPLGNNGKSNCHLPIKCIKEEKRENWRVFPICIAFNRQTSARTLSQKRTQWIVDVAPELVISAGICHFLPSLIWSWQILKNGTTLFEWVRGSKLCPTARISLCLLYCWRRKKLVFYCSSRWWYPALRSL